jgi:hypothetical protein
MSRATVLTLLPQTAFGTSSEVQGSKYPACAYYLSNKDLQTLTWSVDNVIGTLNIEASLVDDPQSTDWFNVHTIDFANTTESGYTNLTGNFVWIRAAITDFAHGTIQHVRLAY